jgi:glycosyltransferase involved in cell wall biosynthesis
MSWHILDTGSIWLKEIACALSSMVPTQNWCPEIRAFGYWEDWERTDQVSDPSIEMIRFPLQRGYARFPVAHLFPFEKVVVARLKRRSAKPELCTLICTTPFYAPVAEQWPGRVVYYLTDLTKEYAGMNANQVIALDRRMCRVAGAVCPNSSRIASYLRNEAGCDPKKVTVVPNATREQNVLDQPLTAPAPVPPDMADLQRPIVGVIGNLAGNMDWLLIADAVDKTKDVSWAFVGPTDMNIPDSVHERARRNLLCRGGRIRFIGPKKYGELCQYARSFDVALMPYRKHEPTYSGSATRFYEHLAACRPILSSRGFHELLTKEPLLKLVDDAEGIAAAVDGLKSTGFYDGVEELRWRTSHENTWSVRARDLLAAATQPARLKLPKAVLPRGGGRRSPCSFSA